MNRIDLRQVRRTYTTHIVLDEACVGYVAPSGHPQIGDLLVAEVASIGKHTSVETISGLTMNIFPGDLIIGAFGNRYATDQYEGYAPAAWRDQCDLLSIGGVCGEVCSAHTSMGSPTRLRVLGRFAMRMVAHSICAILRVPQRLNCLPARSFLSLERR